MVSLYPNPPAQDCYKVVNPIKMGFFPGFNSLSSTTDAAATILTSADNSSMIYGLEDPNNKKVRKPCTVTKCRETWTDQEHDKFIEAVHLFDRDWKKIEAFIGSKTVIQIRSHAQKYFLKVQKNGTSEHVPPPRPKRKAAHPYPQKGPKKELLSAVQLCVTGPIIFFHLLMHHISKIMWGYKDQPRHSCSYSSNRNTPSMWPTSETVNQGKVKHNKPMKVIPDFAQVYSFIASVFDSNESDHLHRLKMMEPINVETVLILMKNLAVNLTSPEFENHRRRLVSSYALDTEKVKSSSPFINLRADKRGDAIPSV